MNIIDVIGQITIVSLVGVGMVSLLAIPAETAEMGRWFAMMLVSKAVGIFAIALAIWLYRQLNEKNV